jgi:hypothetical protein
MLFLRFAMLLERFHNLKFLQIHMVKELTGTSSRFVSSGLVQPDSTIFQQSIDFKKKRMRAFQ